MTPQHYFTRKSKNDKPVFAYDHMRYRVLTFFFKVFNGANATAPLLGKFGNETGPDVTSSGPFLFVRFTSDRSLTNTGFRLRYSCEYLPVAICVRYSRYRDSHYKGKMVVGPSYLYSRTFYVDKTEFYVETTP